MVVCVFSWRVLDVDFGHTVYVFIFLCGNESMYQESFGTSLLTNCDVELESTWAPGSPQGSASSRLWGTVIALTRNCLISFRCSGCIKFWEHHSDIYWSRHDPSWSMMIHHDPWWNMMIHQVIPRCFEMFKFQFPHGSNWSKSGILRKNHWKSWVPSSKEELIIYPLKHEYGTRRDHRSAPGAPRWCPQG